MCPLRASPVGESGVGLKHEAAALQVGAGDSQNGVVEPVGYRTAVDDENVTAMKYAYTKGNAQLLSTVHFISHVRTAPTPQKNVTLGTCLCECVVGHPRRVALDTDVGPRGRLQRRPQC